MSRKLAIPIFLITTLLLAGAGFQPRALAKQVEEPALPQGPITLRVDDLVIADPGYSYDASDAGVIWEQFFTRPLDMMSAVAFGWSEYHHGEELQEAGDRYGSSLAVGDFNGDGYFDLAVGIPGESVGQEGGVASAGAVDVLYSHLDDAFGFSTIAVLGSEGRQLWHQNSPGLTGGAEADDQFGYSLAAGDFNGDGCDDLAIGVPNESLGSPEVLSAGAVQVIYGSTNIGLTSSGSQFWYQDGTPGSLGFYEEHDFFGLNLAAGDFNGDGKDDLAIGIPYEDVDFENVDQVQNAGAINILYGGNSGLSLDGNQFWSQASPGIADNPEIGDTFGFSLAVGDFNGDAKDDLAIGVPAENLGLGPGAEIRDNGAVNILHGGDGGLSDAGDLFLHQPFQAPGDSKAEIDDQFGLSLTTGDFNGDGKDDLTVGVPYEDIEHPQGIIHSDAGIVDIFLSGESGLSTTASQTWIPLGENSVFPTHQFGRSLASGYFNGDKYAELVVGGFVGNSGNRQLEIYSGGTAGFSANSFGTDFSHMDTFYEEDWGWALAALPRYKEYFFSFLSVVVR